MARVPTLRTDVRRMVEAVGWLRQSLVIRRTRWRVNLCVYAGQHLYLLTGLLTRLVGTWETERDAHDAGQADAEVGETR